LAEDRQTIFLGQGVGTIGGTSMTDTFKNVPEHQRLEFPVAEDLQMGTATGLSLMGFVPVCVFPRWNFVMVAMNSLVNHLDRLSLYSDGGYKPKVIIRVGAPHTHPLDAGPQHGDDFTVPIRMMLKTINVVTLDTPGSIMRGYEEAYRSSRSTILVEYTKNYGVIPSSMEKAECSS